MTAAATSLDELCINTIRTLAMDTVQKAKSGHPGTPMGVAPIAHELWTRFLKHNPGDSHWPDRDRFILSAGHASALLYSLLYLTGYGLEIEDLKQFRQFDSRTPGHPERGETPGVELTTGPLGQGFAMGVGMAMAERFLAARYNRPGHEVVSHHTYAICSDGDLMEGIASEAASLAGHLGLGRLVYFYDDNKISIEGDTALAFTEDPAARFAAYGWHVQHIDGNDLPAIARAIESAKAETTRPSLIVARTVIAFGSPNKAGTAEAHGSPLGDDEVRLTKQALGWPEDSSFYVPDDVLRCYRGALDTGRKAQEEWRARVDAYAAAYPAEAAELERVLRGELPAGWASAIPSFNPADPPMATRSASGKVLNALAAVLPNLIGGSADLAPSNNTHLSGEADFGPSAWTGRNLHFGVREHAMGAIVNGMALHGGVLPYGATFFVFTDYMRGALRLAALQDAHSIFVLTHDSIGLGEDGPTHQPVEHLASFRAMPNMCMIRPADANETAAAWKVAIEKQGPVLLILSRQNLPTLAEAAPLAADGVARGAYVLAGGEGEPDVILVATGSEVPIALAARESLAKEGVRARVVSMPSWDLFAAQPQDYRDAVLPPRVRARVAVEAGASFGWERYVGDLGETVGLDHFGASAPYTSLYEHFGITAERVAACARSVLDRSRKATGG